MPDVAILAQSYELSVLIVRFLLVGTNRRKRSLEASDGRLEGRRGTDGPRHSKSRIAQDHACMAQGGGS